MSVIAMSLAIQTKTSDPLAKLLLMLLADRHNGDTGACFAERKFVTLARDVD